MQPGENVTLAELVRSALIGELEQLAKAVKEAADSLTDEQIWRKPTEPGNSVGHLMLHLTGNLNHFVGAQLGGTGYVRDREREFTEANLPTRKELYAQFDSAITMFRSVVGGLTPEQLGAPHPESRFGNVLQTLVHLVAHFALHRGQISYIVRWIKK